MISEVLWHSAEANFTAYAQDINLFDMHLKIIYWKLKLHLQVANEWTIFTDVWFLSSEVQ